MPTACVEARHPGALRSRPCRRAAPDRGPLCALQVSVTKSPAGRTSMPMVRTPTASKGWSSPVAADADLGLARAFPRKNIRKVMGGNVLRVLRAGIVSEKNRAPSSSHKRLCPLSLEGEPCGASASLGLGPRCCHACVALRGSLSRAPQGDSASLGPR